MQCRKRKLGLQPTIAASLSKSTPFEADSSKVRKLNNLLVQTICKDALPFNLLNSDSFKLFVTELEPRYRLPTRKAMSNDLIPSTYDTVKQSVMKTLQEAGAVALTTDAWTSVGNEAFIGVTAHYLLDDFTYADRCLTVKHAPGSHTAEELCKHLEDVCSEWSIKQRSNLLPLYVVTDNGANVKKAVSLMTHAKWVPCFAHTLQLVINTVLQLPEVAEVQELLQAARAIVGHFRRSPVACKKLEQAQDQLGVGKNRLIQDCSTRWNSQVLMLKRLIEQKSAVSLVLSSVSGLRNLDGDQWKAAQYLVDALQPFLDVTTIVSATRYPTLSMVIPLLDGIVDVLKEEENYESIPCLRTALIHELSKRFNHITSGGEMYFVATAVDPRYKLIPFADDMAAMQAKNFVLLAMDRAVARKLQQQQDIAARTTPADELLQSTSSQSQTSSQPDNMELALGCQPAEAPEKKKSIWQKFDRQVAHHLDNVEQHHGIVEHRQRHRMELDMYLTEHVIARSSCPFKWWNENRSRLPVLADVAREFLSIPGTSVPSERLFSKAGDVIRKKRSSLKPKKANQTIFLMENM